MSHAQEPVPVTAFRAEPPEAWPDAVWADRDKALVMRLVGDLVASGAADWGWLAGGAIALHLRSAPVFHLRECEVERIR